MMREGRGGGRGDDEKEIRKLELQEKLLENDQIAARISNKPKPLFVHSNRLL